MINFDFSGRTFHTEAQSLIQPHADHQPDRNPQADKNRSHHDADRHIILCQLVGGVKVGDLVKELVADQHETDGQQGTDDGVDKIEQDNLKLQYLSTPLTCSIFLTYEIVS